VNDALIFPTCQLFFISIHGRPITTRANCPKENQQVETTTAATLLPDWAACFASGETVGNRTEWLVGLELRTPMRDQ
jgi:hypothetical protein